MICGTVSGVLTLSERLKNPFLDALQYIRVGTTFQILEFSKIIVLQSIKIAMHADI